MSTQFQGFLVIHESRDAVQLRLELDSWFQISSHWMKSFVSRNCGIFVLCWEINLWLGRRKISKVSFINVFFSWHEMMIEDCRVSPGCKQGPVCETSWWLKASPSPLASASSTSLSWSSSSNFFSSSHTKEALRSTSIIVTLSSKCTWTKVTCDLRHSSLPVGRISCCVTTCNSQQNVLSPLFLNRFLNLCILHS